VFQEADGGTLFLDEIGTCPLDAGEAPAHDPGGRNQAVGSNQTVRVDVRFNRGDQSDLLRAVEGGVFREDLYTG